MALRLQALRGAAAAVFRVVSVGLKPAGKIQLSTLELGCAAKKVSVQRTEASNQYLACLKYMMNWSRPIGGIGKGVLKIYDEPGICTSGGVFKIYDEPESAHEGACLSCMKNRNRQNKRRVYDIS